MQTVIDSPTPFNFVIGARGTGKTYGALKSVLVDRPQKFIYMRRLQTQVDMIRSNESMNPFNPIARDCHKPVIMHNINKYVSGVYNSEQTDEGKTVPVGAPLGYVLALSTISNLRGFDMSDVDVLIWDEFIPEGQESRIKNEGMAFLNAVETIARNRELQDRPPLKVVCLANSNELANPVFIELELVTYVEKMIRKDLDLIRIDDRGISIYVCSKVPVSEKKRQTSLYKLSKGTKFSQMALDNSFITMEVAEIGSRDLSHYDPLVKVGELVIYENKRTGEFYVTTHAKGSYEEYTAGQMDLKRFRRNYYFLWLAYLNRNIVFESYILQILYEKYFGMLK